MSAQLLIDLIRYTATVTSPQLFPWQETETGDCRLMQFSCKVSLENRRACEIPDFGTYGVNVSWTSLVSGIRLAHLVRYLWYRGYSGKGPYTASVVLYSREPRGPKPIA